MNAHTPITPEPRAFVATLPDLSPASQINADRAFPLSIEAAERLWMTLDAPTRTRSPKSRNGVPCHMMQGPPDLRSALDRMFSRALCSSQPVVVIDETPARKALAHYGAMDAEARPAAMVGAIFGVVGSSRS